MRRSESLGLMLSDYQDHQKRWAITPPLTEELLSDKDYEAAQLLEALMERLAILISREQVA